MRTVSSSQPAGADGAGQPRRLLFVVNVAWFFISHRLAIARAAREAGYDVHVLAAFDDPKEIARIESEGITFHRASIRRGSRNPFADLPFILTIFRTIRSVSPTHVHNVTIKAVLYGTIVARLLRVPSIVNAISGLGYSFIGKSRWLLSSLLRTAYRWTLRSPRVHVIFQNKDDQALFIAWRAVDERQTVLIKGSGVDLSAYAGTPPDQGDLPLVVLPARMLRDKGVCEFVEAAGQLRDRGCRARFALAGGLDSHNPAALSRQELESITQAAGVEWLGFVEDIPGLYQRAHIVCLPSYREGLPKALIEACAAARPIVTTDVPGCREVVDDGVNGLLVPARDATSLADALQRLIEDPEMRARFGEASRRKAADFDIRSVVQKTLDLYSRAT